MGFNNRVFDINGETQEHLRQAFRLAFALDSTKNAAAWKIDPKHGIVFCWGAENGTTPFPVPISPDAAADIAWEWLKTDAGKATKIDPDSWFGDCDHDGHNIHGWRAYVERWGHVGDSRYSIVAVHHSYLWIGK